MATIEETGKNLEEATQKALEQLGVTEDQVDVEILEEGSKGFLGLGTAPAKVRVTTRKMPTEPKPREAAPEGRPPRRRRPPAPRREAEPAPQREARREARPESRPEPRREAKPESRPEPRPEPRREAKPEGRPAQPRREPRPPRPKPAPRPAPVAPKAEEVAPEPEAPEAVVTAEVIQQAAEIGREALQKIIEGIGDGGNVVIKTASDSQVVLDMIGGDTARVIGRHGQTIDSIQYLVGIIVNKKIGAKVRVVVDAEGYRERREETLKNQALTLAKKVKETGQEAVLESLHSNERRVIHTALADDPDVYTYSEGEDPNRFLVISPKKQA